MTNQPVSLATHPAAFNPNDPNTWITLITGIEQLLTILLPLFGVQHTAEQRMELAKQAAINPMLLAFLIRTGINSGLYAMTLLTSDPATAALEKDSIGTFVDEACALYGWTVTRN